MEGDLTPHMGGTYSLEAGVIPRTLYRLFHDLESEANEFSVHASFVELYNEELRDLLNNEAPTPLGAGGSGGGSGLKMFEDPKGRGVRIQGLEDTPLRDAQHGLALLRKGAQKRQIAATKCNESSSRSHSVFSLTVHIKETTSKGEDMLRTGKLNLVDLAGSENIGRSGAENKRAREAGIINQSLLTLGRVINALVEKSSHIPYRESKLTRLLQESLGGRTKTCIIATVSPEKANMEETLSTLDYALRAKSIRNRPEMNQRMTRAALIKEYVNEIERLKGDLLASREKNGIYHSFESWSAMQDEQEGAKKQIEELRRSDEVIKSKMNSLQEQFDQNMQLLVKRENESKAVKQESAERRAEVDRLTQRLDELRRAEEEERTLSQAYARSEAKLNVAASNLKALLDNSKGDVDGLFAKLHRKSQVEARISSKVVELQSSIKKVATEMGSGLDGFGQMHEDFTTQLATRLHTFSQSQEGLVQEQLQCLDEKLHAIRQQVQRAHGSSDQQRATLDSIASDLDAARGGLLSATEARTKSLREGCKTLLEQVAASNGPAVESVKRSLARMSDVMATIVKGSHAHLDESKERLEGLSSVVDARAQDEIRRLEGQNEQLKKLLSLERQRSSDAKAKITSLLSGLFDERDKALDEVVDAMQSSNKEAQRHTQEFVQTHSVALEEAQEGAHRFHHEIDEAGQDSHKDRIKAERVVDKADESLRAKLTDFVERDFSRLVEEELKDVQEATEGVSKGVVALRDEADAGATSRRTEIESFGKDVEEMCGEAGQGFETLLNDARGMTSEAADALDEQYNARHAFEDGTKEQIEILRSHGDRSDVVVKDVSTGATPEKRKWQEADKGWQLVPKSRALAIKQHRRRLEAAELAGVTSVSVAFSDGSEDEMGALSGEEAEREEEEVEGGLGLLGDGDETFTEKNLAKKKQRGRSTSRSTSPVVSKKRAAIASLGLGLGPGPHQQQHHHHHNQPRAVAVPLRETDGNRVMSGNHAPAPVLHKARPTSSADAIAAKRVRR